ncbi:hypothetical protein [Streptomyces sp. NPDC059209]|uniref:hypothetical protein n=1 Tax=Streptomyces sp. NPDC059209 TaxID=3346769 RepID=UPI0036C4307E
MAESREFPYGIDDVRWAGSHGYGTDIGRRIARAKEQDPNQRYFRSLPAERRRAALLAANGPRPRGLTARTPGGAVLTRSDEGCGTASQDALYGDAAAWFQARASVDEMDAVRVRRTLEDPAYRRALGPWSTCMRAAGHPYTSPAKARVAMTSSPGTVSAEDEREAATAEAGCMRDSGLAGVAERLDARHDRLLRLAYGDAVTTAADLRAEALPRARRIAGEARP